MCLLQIFEADASLNECLSSQSLNQALALPKTKKKKEQTNKQTKQNKKTTLSVRVYFIDILPETSTVIFLLGKHCAYVLSRFSNIGLFETLWTVAHQGPLSIGFSRQE